MTDHNYRSYSTAELNRFIMIEEELAMHGQYGAGRGSGELDAIRAEKDRRLADPNSSDFRPTFF